MAYFLVRVDSDVERTEETADWIARHLAVSFHAEAAARPWAVNLDETVVIDKPNAWHLYLKGGDKFVPHVEEVVVDGIGEDGEPIVPREELDV